MMQIPMIHPGFIPGVKDAVQDLVAKKDAMQWRGSPKAMQNFLNSMEVAMWSFNNGRGKRYAPVEPAVNRDYRNRFSYSYIHFFTKLKSAFAYGIIMGLTRVRDGLVVNSKSWQITDEIAVSGTVLEAKWDALMYMIHSIRWMDDSEWANIEHSYVPHLRRLLMQFDSAYCHYEKVLIPWLMEIEAHTRNFLSDIINCACDEDSIESMHNFTKYIAQLNSLCNKRGKGRSDFSYDEVQIAINLLAGLDSPTAENLNPRLRPTLQSLVDAFHGARKYFVKLKTNLLCVDPQLSNNYQLRNHCERFEAAWERVHGLCAKNRWQAVSTVFSFLEKHAIDLDCSTVEGALWVPRLMLLSSWEAPEVSPLFELFSPHVSDLMDNLRKKYLDTFPTTDEALKAARQESAFMCSLEDISIRLQRDHSTQWNQFLQLVHQSFDSEETKPTPTKFQ